MSLAGRRVVGGGGASLPAFAFETEAQAVITAMTAGGDAPNARRQLAINKCVKRLKQFVGWSKIDQLWITVADAQSSALINWKNPGTNDLVINGSPVFTVRAGFIANSSTSNFLDTGVALSSLDPANVSVGLYTNNSGANGTNTMGALSGGNGISVNPKSSSSGATFALMGPVSSAITPGSSWDGIGGFNVASRNNTSTFAAQHIANKVADVTNTSAAIASGTTITICKVNGGSGASNRPVWAAFLGKHLTQQEITYLNAAVGVYIDVVQNNGDVEYHEPGVAPTIITVDAVVYGATAQGVVAAYELARQGKTVALVGGWRERQIGGVSTGGLGYADFTNVSMLGGLTRDIFNAVRVAQGLDTTSIRFDCRFMLRELRKRLNPADVVGEAVPVYWSNGVSSVAKTGTRITSFSTADGRTFSGKYFVDATYEGDLLALAGCDYVIGREAAGSGVEAVNGFLGINADTFNQYRAAGTGYNIDPYVTPGVPASGLLVGVEELPVGKAVGDADDKTQAYNFRLAWSTVNEARLPFPSTVPTDYALAKYESLARLMAAGPTIGISDVLTTNVVSGVLDRNNGGAVSTNYFGGSDAYVAAANYAAREAIWKAHEYWIRGFAYFLVHEPDSRVATTGLRTTMAGYGESMYHHLDHHENDLPHWPTQLYVREFRRLRGDILWDGNDLNAPDGAAPRSIKTVSVASYVIDSHHGQRFVDPNGGTPRIWNSGNLSSTMGNGNSSAPLPYEIFLPKAAQVTNLFVPFCVSATHVAFGSIRMEASSMQAAASGAIAICEALENGEIDLQSVNYTNLRTRILALPDTAAVLPQTN
jgi:hypothetical protein